MLGENGGKESEELLSDLGLRLGAPFGERPRKYVENGLRPCLDMGFIGIERKKKNLVISCLLTWKFGN